MYRRSYVLLTLVGGRGGRQECRSPAEPNTANPVYDLCCDMESPEAGLLRIQIFDYDEFSHHKEIGACKLRQARRRFTGASCGARRTTRSSWAQRSR